MLGWEFPPIINGGLGIACHDLSAALSKMANITMIIPKSSPEFKMKNVNLIGLNALDAAALGKYISFYQPQMPFQLREVPVDINPYFSSEEKNYGNISDVMIGKQSLESFQIENLYGGDVIRKVMQFADISTAMSSEIDFDIIHAHDWMTMIAGAKIKKQTGKPLVMHIHSLETDRSGSTSGWVYDLEKKGMEYADMLIPVSNFTAESIHRHYGISKSKMKVAHNGSKPVKPFRSVKPFHEKLVLFVGRITRQKGPEKFLEIAERVLRIKSDVRFVMAGTGDNFRSMLDQSSYKSLGNRFHLTGFLNLEKLNYLLSVSDVYCMPSLSEPFGLSAVEAAQFGVPCVISKQSGVSEVLNGSLKFDFWDVNKAADYILNLLDDSVLRSKVVQDSKENLKNISWEISAKKVMNAYSHYVN